MGRLIHGGAYGPTRFEKGEFCGFLKSIFSLSIKAYFLSKASKIVFHDLFSLSITLEYRGLQGVKRGYRGLEVRGVFLHKTRR